MYFYGKNWREIKSNNRYPMKKEELSKKTPPNKNIIFPQNLQKLETKANEQAELTKKKPRNNSKEADNK